MKHFKVLGSGCSKCTKTVEIIQSIANELAVEATVEKVTNPETIMMFGVMSTPAVVLNETLVHSGSIPHRADIEAWLSQ